MLENTLSKFVRKLILGSFALIYFRIIEIPSLKIETPDLVSRSWHSVLEFGQFFHNMGSSIFGHFVSLACFPRISQTIFKRGLTFPNLQVGSKVVLSRKWRFWRIATNWFFSIAFLIIWCYTSGASSQDILYDNSCTYSMSIKIAIKDLIFSLSTKV